MTRRKIKKIKGSEKIAAGEVVDRPANVVKELIENSIDAGAREIKVIVKQAGKESIQVIDDGSGIFPEDIEIAFERHTSSKIRCVEDLDNLSTLGFRGEALASIAAVSVIELNSRTPDNLHGVKLLLKGGIVRERTEISCEKGTSIIVKNLFFNIPARKKFLKKDYTELAHITDIIQRYSLAYPEIHFMYIHNTLTVLNSPSTNELKTVVFHLYGKNVAKKCEVINYESDGDEFKVYGLLGHPSISKKSRKDSSFFINRRYLVSDLVFNAVFEAYKDMLMVGMHPFFVLFLDLNPSIVDFNVHPKKLEIRFEDEEYISNKLYRIVREFIETKFIQEEEKYLSTNIKEFLVKERESYDSLKDADSTENSNYETNFQQAREIVENSIEEKAISAANNGVQLKLDDINASQTEILDSVIRESVVKADNFPSIRLLAETGQLSNHVYIVLEGISNDGVPGIYILDQHAASERINKEFFQDLYEREQSFKQQLISPLLLKLSPSTKFFVLEYLNDINKLGFELEFFGGNDFLLKAVPTIFKKVISIELITEIISDLSEIGKDSSFSEKKKEIFNYLACHRSIRGGEKLTIRQIKNLLFQLSKCKDPYHCAHGRPTLKFISFKDLDKLFKRIV